MIFGVGTDIIEVPRIEERLARRAGFRDVIFTSREIASELGPFLSAGDCVLLRADVRASGAAGPRRGWHR